jgi:hypothetical protein
MEEHQPQSVRAPVNRISGDSVTVLKTSLQDTGAGSGVQVDTFVDIDDMAIVEDQGTASFGVDAHGDGRGKAGIVRLGAGTILLGYDYGFYGEMGTLYADDVLFGGAANDGCYPVNGTAIVAVNALANGNGRRGFTAYGNFVNLTGGSRTRKRKRWPLGRQAIASRSALLPRTTEGAAYGWFALRVVRPFKSASWATSPG